MKWLVNQLCWRQLNRLYLGLIKEIGIASRTSAHRSVGEVQIVVREKRLNSPQGLNDIEGFEGFEFLL